MDHANQTDTEECSTFSFPDVDAATLEVCTCFGEHAIPQQLEQEHPQDKWHCKCRFEHIRAGSDREQAHNLTGRR